MKTLEGEEQAAGEYELFRSKNVVFYANGCVNENQGEKKHSCNNFAYTADDSLSKEKEFQSSS